MNTNTNLDLILENRCKTYGDYRDNAKTMQDLKRMFREHPGWARLNDMHREALDMFALKIGRILVGDPDHRDSWDDIAGYARCVSERIPPVGVTVLTKSGGKIRAVEHRRLEDGLTVLEADVWWPTVSVRDPEDGQTYYIVDRARFSPDDYDHLSRLQREMNTKELKEATAWWRGLYYWSVAENKWMLKSEFLEHWSDSP